MNAMNIIICGAGEVGRHAAEVLGAEGNNITVIDHREDKLAEVEETLDVGCLEGNGVHANILREAGFDHADLFLAATGSDEINLLSASIASGVGAGRTIARIHHSAYFDHQGLDYAQHLGVDHLVCPEYATAVAIAQTLRNPAAIAVERFARGHIEMQRLPVNPKAVGIGKPLAEVGLPKGTLVAVIERNGQAFIPDADTTVTSRDIITLVGDVDVFDQARKLFHNEQAKRQRIMIMGGTAMGVWLSRALRSRAFSVRLFEADATRSDELAEKLSWVTVFRADATDPTILDEEQVEQADAFVTLTSDDEHNILAAARAKSLGAQHAIAVVQRQTYLHLLEHIGIDRAFSPRTTAVKQVVKLLHTDPVQHLATLAKGVADVYDVHVSGNAKAIAGTQLRDLKSKLPYSVIVTAIQRNQSVFVPGAEDSIEIDDRVILIGPSALETRLRKTFVTG